MTDDDVLLEEMRQERLTRTRPIELKPSPYNPDLTGLILHISDNTTTTFEMNDNELRALRELITIHLGDTGEVLKALGESRARYGDLEARVVELHEARLRGEEEAAIWALEEFLGLGH